MSLLRSCTIKSNKQNYDIIILYSFEFCNDTKVNKEIYMWTEGPNIFDYATSELSQDAFFAWFLMWAREDFNNANFRQLHKCAKEMIYTFFRDYGIDLEKKGIEKIDSIEINKQWNYIDLWVKINKNII